MLCVSLLGVGALSADAPDAPSLKLFERPDEQARARAMLPSFISTYGSEPLRKRRQAELDALKTREQWRARQRRARKRLAEFFGPFPARTPLNPRIVGKIDREKHVIEKLIFESQPSYYVTANFYVPKGRPLPAPGVIFTCGHAAEGKAAPLYHEACLGLVLKGYVVLALDPMGQGERSEYFDAATREHIVRLCVPQHHQLGRPAFLVGRTLSGHRTWDCIRAVDYLVSRPEVDADRLAAVGNSGGGQMALLITAADERINVCAAAHPGGSMENTYLAGRTLIDREVLSLIPPRPCRMIVGDESGEEPGHRRKMEDMLQFYEGLGVGAERGELVLVDGVHDMKQPKREAAYEWLNRWFDKDAEGSAEPPLAPEEVAALNCTDTGFTLSSLGGETGQTLNETYMAQIMPRRTAPPDRPAAEAAQAQVKAAVMRRLALKLPEQRPAPPARVAGTFREANFTAEKIVYESEPGITIPALLMAPEKPLPTSPVLLHAAERGKPSSAAAPSVATGLARRGYIVLSIDVRGVGETDPRGPGEPKSMDGYDRTQWSRDCLAIDAAYMGRTMAGMRTIDVVRGVDYVKAHGELADDSVVLIGEGLGGLWALAAAALDERVAGVVCVETLLSYTMLVRSKYHRVRGYFWVPGVLHDFDLPDLAALVAPRPVLWLDGINAMAERVAEDEAAKIIGRWPASVYTALGAHANLRFARTPSGAPDEAVQAIASFLQK